MWVYLSFMYLQLILQVCLVVVGKLDYAQSTK